MADEGAGETSEETQISDLERLSDPLLIGSTSLQIPIPQALSVVYHGTSGRNFKSILDHGLRPSFDVRRNNYNTAETRHLIPRRDQVYLAGWHDGSQMSVVSHAINIARKDGEFGVALLVGVRIDDLDDDQLFPDEDSLIEWVRLPSSLTREEKLILCKRSVDHYQGLWRKSLATGFETVAHRCTVLPNQISEVTVFPVLGILSDLFLADGHRFLARQAHGLEHPSHYKRIIETWLRGQVLSRESAKELGAYVSALVAGGLGAALPNQATWNSDLNRMMKETPASVSPTNPSPESLARATELLNQG